MHNCYASRLPWTSNTFYDSWKVFNDYFLHAVTANVKHFQLRTALRLPNELKTWKKKTPLTLPQKVATRATLQIPVRLSNNSFRFRLCTKFSSNKTQQTFEALFNMFNSLQIVSPMVGCFQRHSYKIASFFYAPAVTGCKGWWILSMKVTSKKKGKKKSWQRIQRGYFRRNTPSFRSTTENNLEGIKTSQQTLTIVPLCPSFSPGIFILTSICKFPSCSPNISYGTNKNNLLSNHEIL